MKKLMRPGARCAIERIYIFLYIRYLILIMASNPITVNLNKRSGIAALAAIFIATIFMVPGIAFAVPAPPPPPAGCVKISIAIDVKGTPTNCVPIGGSGNANVIFTYLFGIIKFLTTGAGILSVGGIIVGGIRYSLAQGNPGKIQKAIVTMISSVIGLFLFFILAVLFNFLVPGGLFK